METNKPDFIDLPCYETLHYKRFFPKYEKKASVEDAQNLPAVAEEANAVAVAEPAGKLIDDGPLTDIEMGIVSANLVDLTAIPFFVPNYGSARCQPRNPTIEYSVTYNPDDAANEKRTVLIQDLLAEINVYLVVIQLVQSHINFRVFPAPTTDLYFKGSDGKRTVYGMNSTLIVFKKAIDAKEFVEEFGDVSLMVGSPPQAVSIQLLDTPTHPCFGM